MTKHRIHHKLEDDMLETPERPMPGARMQETWEEFKEQSNQAAEAVIDEVTHPDQLRARAHRASRRVRGFYTNYKRSILVGAVLITAGVLFAIVKPALRKKFLA